MMNLTYSVVAASLVAVLSMVDAALANEERQAYCGMYFGRICFPASSIVAQRIAFPAAFSIDEIDLAGGSHVTFYEGIGLAEQDDATNVPKVKSFVAEGKTVDIYIGSSPHGLYFDVHLETKGQWGVVQMFGYIRDSGDAERISDFLTSIHFCTHRALAVQCTPGVPLAGAADFLRNQKP